MRRRPLLLLALFAPSALAASGGPDAQGMVWTDSTDADGPSHVWLDASGGDAHALGADDGVTVDLPFPFPFYGVDYESLTVSTNGVVSFDGSIAGSTPACPDTTSFTGLAVLWDDWAATTVHTATFGTYPWRTFVVSWDAVSHATWGGSGRFQLQLLEGRGEAVLVLDDLSFGAAAVDGGAGATVGASGAGGLAYACAGGIADGTSVWFGDQQSRPARADVNTDELDDPWYGVATFAYAGQAMTAKDVDGDGWDDVLVANPGRDAGQAYLLYRPWTPDSLGNADAVFSGETGSDSFGSGLALTDLDGDGLTDLAIGAPGNDDRSANAGTTYLFSGGGFVGAWSYADADLAIQGPGSDRAASGAPLDASADVDGDGYLDLLIAATDADDGAVNAGTVHLFYGGALGTGTTTTDSADAAFAATALNDSLGTALAAGDLDADGRAEVLIGAPDRENTVTDAGAVYIFAGGSWSGLNAAEGTASCITRGTSASAGVGTTLLVADLDGSGLLDLVTGGHTYDTPYADAGGAWIQYDPGLTGCASTTSAADAEVQGDSTAANLGKALAAGDLDGDGVDDLVIAAPNQATAAAGGGVAYVFTTPPSGTVSASAADHQVRGAITGSALGTQVGVLDDPDDHGALAITGPYATWSLTGDGALWAWDYAPDFLDADGDGFVDADAGGNDCDDADPSAHPGGTDTDGDSVDGDCDGWTDGVVRVRDDADAFAWDLAELRAGVTEVYDFESYADGDVVGSYGSITFTGTVWADSEVYGSLPLDTLGARVDTVASTILVLDFDRDVDALGWELLDPEDDFVLTAIDADGAVVASYAFAATADDRYGGVTQGFTFIRPIRTLELGSATTDGWGLDDLQVAWAEDSDRDLDGFSELEGDCDDDDANRHPGATEDLGNGVDDDCDGIVDAGDADQYADAAAWAAAAGITAEIIDFEDLAAGDPVDDQYADLGALFADAPEADAEVDGTAPRDSLAASATAGAITVYFDEDQPALAFYLLDGDGGFTVDAGRDGVVIYTAAVTPGSSEHFVGFVFDYAINELVITPTSDSAWGIDDLSFSQLGLDDADGDGLTEAEGDCDDDDATVYPDAEETWYDGVDQDCAGDDDDDQDGDGYPLALDCDDEDGAVSPDAEETWYDGVDQDCSGGSDYDADGDLHDDVEWGGDDCDDGDAAVSPDAEETWYDGVDQDCAGDDDYDADGDGFPWEGFGGGDCDDSDASVSPEAVEEYYDGVDQDCSGAAESDYDADEDGHDALAWGGDDCDDGEPTAYPGATGEACYDGVDTDCDGGDDYDCDLDGHSSDAYGGTDCDDADPTVNPSAPDPAGDGVDANCDGRAEFDDDGDNVDGVEDGGTDCDDADATVYPGAVETCYDGVDQDCDGWSDFDCDRDAHDDASWGGDDCDDADRATYPGAPDFPYDGVDHDCGGEADFDQDGDGQDASWYGGADCDDEDPTVYAGAGDTCYDGVDTDCAADSDWDCDRDGHDDAEYGGDDCDDGDASAYPGATEVAGDGVDQDCDGLDGLACDDCDGDGVDGVEAGGTDCDDDDPAAFPGAPEIWYDGVDQDCLGGDDYDQDGDGARASAWGGGDCADQDPAIGPFVTEDGCDGQDQDCDGRIDEDCVTPEDDTAAPTDDTATPADDTGPPNDTGPEDWRPDGEPPEEPEYVKLPETRGCGCASAPPTPVAASLLALALLRRRRPPRRLGEALPGTRVDAPRSR